MRGEADNLVDALRARSSLESDRLAFRILSDSDTAPRAVTYGEIGRHALAIAGALHAAGATGERVVVAHPPGLDYISSLFGCWYAGAIAVPAHPPRDSRSTARLLGIVEDSGARLALAADAEVDAMGNGRPNASPRHDAGRDTPPRSDAGSEKDLARLRWIATDRIAGSGAHDTRLPLPCSPDGLALLQYTSGSTHTPKGVMLSHAHFVRNIEALAKQVQLTPDDRIVSWLPPYHDMGLLVGILGPIFLGKESTLLSPSAFLQRPHRWLRAISDFRATISAAPNFAYELCARRVGSRQRDELDLSSWRMAFVGAERVRAVTLERFADVFAASGFRKSAFRPSYGLAEATLAVSFDPPGPAAETMVLSLAALARGNVERPAGDSPGVTVVSCGSPVPGCDVAIVDPQTREKKSEGRIGEIWVSSPSVALGYWALSPEQNDQVFRALLEGHDGASHSYLRTGDLGFLSHGQVYVTGRLKDLIILSGLNHHPEDIEATVASCHPALRMAGGAAFSVEIDDEERLVIAHEVNHPREAAASEIAAAIRGAVADVHELSVHDVVLVPPGAIPKTASGKVQRGACRSLYLNGELPVVASVPLPAPEPNEAAPEVARRIRAIVEELLGIEGARLEDDFFALGGDSLLATQLASRVRDRLRVELPLRVIFEARTLSAIAARIPGLPEAAPVTAPVSRTADGEHRVLSFSQERMWFMHRLDATSAAYNVAGAVSIDGALDVAALEQAFRAIGARHEVLRASFTTTAEGEPRVHVAPHVPFALAPVDLSAEPDAETRAIELASELARMPFDIASGPLVRIALYRVGADRHVLASSMHHLVTDAWSMGVVFRDMATHYEAFVEGGAPPSNGADVSYFDYAQWQRSELGRERLADDLAYWKQTLAGMEPLELPTDRPRSARRSWTGSYEPLPLSADLFRAVQALAVARGVTPFMVFLAGFVALLHRYTGQRDVTVGVPVANRNRLISEGLVGTLVNMLPVRVACEPTMSFDSLLARVREASLGAYAHQDLPFERLVSELPVERRPGESPVVQVMFDFQNAPTASNRAGGLSFRPRELSRGASQFDLSLVIFDTQLGRMAGVEYSTELFEAPTIRRLLGHFAAILASSVGDPSRRVDHLALVTPEERADLVAWANRSFSVPPIRHAAHELFEQQAADTPDALAVSDEDGQLTYRALAERAERLAGRLRRLGAGPGIRVAVLLDRSREVLVALIATLKTGAAYVPVDPRYPSARVHMLLEDAGAGVVITQPSLAPLVPANSRTALISADEQEPAAVDGQPAAASDLASPAYVLFTSGSTGKPKGVVVSSGALSSFLRSMRREPGIGPGDRLLCVTTIAFDIAELELWLPVVSGASVHVAPADVVADGPRLRALVERISPTVMQATPATWRMLIEAGWRGDRRLKILCGGEAMSRELADALLGRCGSLWNMYGPTETTIWSTLHRVSAGAHAVPIGMPIDRTRVYVLDGNRELVPRGVPGEIYIGGDGVALGYLGRPDLTRERFVADALAPEPGAMMYRTGDLGRLRSDGVLEHLGRLDHQIKLRGFRIEPAEIEMALKEAGLVREAVVIAREDRPGNVRLVAYYTATSDGARDPAELREALVARLPAYMVPSSFVAMSAIPLTPNGKLDRAALPAPEESHAAVERERVAPRDELEAALVRLWGEVLGSTGLGIRDDFFLLGGDSLMAVRLVVRIERELGIEVPLVVLLKNPTIEALASQLHARAARVEAPISSPTSLVPLQSGTGGPPLVCVHGAGGHVLNMMAIARHVGRDQAFLAVQALGVDGISKPRGTIEEMAADYLRELRQNVPSGPYYLSGYCGGGLVAFEMARMLQADGEQVAMLALIDIYRPGSIPVKSLPERFIGVARRHGAAGVVQRARVWATREGTAFKDSIAVAYHRLRGVPVPLELRDFWLTQSFLRTAEGYRPGVFRGRLAILRAVEIDPIIEEGAPYDLGWKGFASEGVDVFDIPGGHETLTREPYVAVLGAALRAQLTAAKTGR